MLQKKDQASSNKGNVLCRYIETDKEEKQYLLADDQYEEINKSYDLLQADPLFDLWSYEVVFYQMLACKPLFGSDAYDNLVSSLELQHLHEWNTVDVEKAVDEVDSVLRFEFGQHEPEKRLAAMKLAGKLLQPDPQKR
eukprot:12795543-Ditylum_brightwellii.AAC.1